MREIDQPEFHSVKEYVLTLLPEPRDISMAPDNSAEMHESGDPREVLVGLTQTEVQVYRCSCIWTGPHGRVKDPQLQGTVDWRQTDAGLVYRGLIQQGQKQRRRSFRKCRYCGETFGPEHRHSKDI